MTSGRAKTLVLVSLAFAAVIASTGDISKGRLPRAQLFAGSLVAGVMLTGLAEVTPKLAAGFAGTVLVGSALTAGPDAIRNTTGLLSSPGKRLVTAEEGGYRKAFFPTPTGAPIPQPDQPLIIRRDNP